MQIGATKITMPSLWVSLGVVAILAVALNQAIPSLQKSLIASTPTGIRYERTTAPGEEGEIAVTNTEPIYPGSALKLLVRRCNDSPDPITYKSTRTLQRKLDGRIVNIAVYEAVEIPMGVGCETIPSELTRVPDNSNGKPIFPGTYRVYFVSTSTTNSGHTNSVQTSTAWFEVQ